MVDLVKKRYHFNMHHIVIILFNKINQIAHRSDVGDFFLTCNLILMDITFDLFIRLNWNFVRDSRGSIFYRLKFYIHLSLGRPLNKTHKLLFGICKYFPS